WPVPADQQFQRVVLALIGCAADLYQSPTVAQIVAAKQSLEPPRAVGLNTFGLEPDLWFLPHSGFVPPEAREHQDSAVASVRWRPPPNHHESFVPLARFVVAVVPGGRAGSSFVPNSDLARARQTPTMDSISAAY